VRVRAPRALCECTLRLLLTLPPTPPVLDLYNKEGMVVEPAGALSVAALDDFAFAIKGKKVVCVISGSNADVCVPRAAVRLFPLQPRVSLSEEVCGGARVQLTPMRRARPPAAGTGCRRSRSGRCGTRASGTTSSCGSRRTPARCGSS
jgi:hypothetical protein